MIWAAENLGAAWAWKPVEVGAFAVLISAVTLLVAQTRAVVSEQARWSLAFVGSMVIGVGWFVAGARTPVVPVAWLCGALIAGQFAVLILGRDKTDTKASE